MIKRFDDFINETELVGKEMGSGFGTTELGNNTIGPDDTSLIYSDLDGKFYTMDEYNQLYQDYLKSGGGPLNGFNKENIDKMIVFLQEKQ
jgi:hypothetical protein